MKIKIKKILHNAKTPTQAKDSDAGYDLYSCESYIINPMERAVIRTGIAIEIPKGYYGRVAPRSGLAIKKGIDTMAGVIDSGYRGEVGVVLMNLNLPDDFGGGDRAEALGAAFGQRNKFKINHGDRIAQLIIEKCHDIKWVEVEEILDTSRGEEGFGSSGKC